MKEGKAYQVQILMQQFHVANQTWPRDTSLQERCTAARLLAESPLPDPRENRLACGGGQRGRSGMLTLPGSLGTTGECCGPWHLGWETVSQCGVPMASPSGFLQHFLS